MYLGHQDTCRDHVELYVHKEGTKNLTNNAVLNYVKENVSLASFSGSPVLSENFLLHIKAALYKILRAKHN